MLEQLHIKNFAIIDELTIDFKLGMTVFTGETGAGKSILIDAINLALGDRLDGQIIRKSQSRAEVSAIFSVKTLIDAKNWLLNNAYEGDEDSLILRRVFHKEGRSQAFINGHAATLTQLREIGHLLLTIHGQHDQQQLLMRDHQRHLLDLFAGNQTLLATISLHFREWKRLEQQLLVLQQPNQSIAARADFLRYQLQELSELALQENEVTALHQEFKKLDSAEQIIQACQAAIHLCALQEQDTICDRLYTIQNSLSPYANVNAGLANALQLLQNAEVEVQEAVSEIKHYLDHAELNPEKLVVIERRLQSIHDVARKHHVLPEELYEQQNKLQQELNNIEHQAENIVLLQQQIAKTKREYHAVGAILSAQRQKAAKQLSQLVTENIRQLGMPNGQFTIDLIKNNSEDPTAFGEEAIQFMMVTNRGQVALPLAKIVSGGELSRIALAIDVITASLYATPTIIFDEIDTGIGGVTAAIVGKLLNKLSLSAQIFCVTHQAQVAVNGAHHIKVIKEHDHESTRVIISSLTKKERINELARMLGGITITKQTLAHAKEMLESCVLT